jgi:hypothetical protein
VAGFHLKVTFPEGTEPLGERFEGVVAAKTDCSRKVIIAKTVRGIETRIRIVGKIVKISSFL